MSASVAVPQADFALNLLRHSGNSSTALIYSPFSITIALAMACLGAKGNTKQQINNVLASGVDEGMFNTYLHNELKAVRKDHAWYALKLASRLYVDKQFSILPKYLQDVESNFANQLMTADFKQPNAVAKDINTWVDNVTNSKIRNLITPAEVEGSELIIANAIYFNGTWVERFDAAETQEETFYAAQNRNRQVDMMHNNAKFDYFEDGNIQVLCLPYISNEIKMCFFLPKMKFGLASWENNLNGQKLLQLMRSVTRSQVNIKIPKFKLELKLVLREILSSLGIKDAFSKIEADFSGISKRPLYISQGVHKAFIEVNEKGSEAAAATFLVAVGAGFMMEEPETVYQFIADHPFLFIIAKNETLLFVGRYT